MNLNKIGYWQVGNNIGVLTSDNIFICLDKTGRISTEIVQPNTARFVASNLSKLLRTMENTPEYLPFEEVYLTVCDELEEYIIEEDLSDYYSYDGEEDETRILWYDVPLHLVYLAVLNGAWAGKTKAVSAIVNLPMFLSTSPLHTVDTDSLALAQRIYQRLTETQLDSQAT